MKKRTERGGEFTYTSERNEARAHRQGDDKEIEFLGWVSQRNDHVNANNAEFYDSARLEGSSF